MTLPRTDADQPPPDPAALLLAVLVPAATMFNEEGPWTPWDSVISAVVLTVLIAYSWKRVPFEPMGIRLATAIVYGFLLATMAAWFIQLRGTRVLIPRKRLGEGADEEWLAFDVQADRAISWGLAGGLVASILLVGYWQWRRGAGKRAGDFRRRGLKEPSSDDQVPIASKNEPDLAAAGE